MTVLYVEPLGWRGMAGYNRELIAAYEARGHSVTVIGPGEHAAASAGPVARLLTLAFSPSVRRWRRGLCYLAALSLAAKRLSRHDLVVYHIPHFPPLDIAFLLVARALSAKVAIVAHDPRPVTAVSFASLHRIFFRLADVLVVHGEAARIDVLSYGVRAPVAVVPHGDFREETPLSAGRACEALDLTSPLPRPVLLIVGNLKPGKGIRRVIVALGGGATEFDGSLLIAGKPQRDAGVEAFVAEAGEGLGVQTRLVSRRLTPFEELAAYSLADVVLALYTRGYSSGVIARAHALRKPVIIADVGDLASQAIRTDRVLRADWEADELRSAVEAVLLPCRTEAIRVDPWIQHVEAVAEALTRTRILDVARAA